MLFTLLLFNSGAFLQLSRAPLSLSFPRRPLFFWIGTGLLMMLFDLFGCIDERVYSFLSVLSLLLLLCGFVFAPSPAALSA